MSQHGGPKANLADFLWSRPWDLEQGLQWGGTYRRQLCTWETLETRRAPTVSIVIIIIVTVRLQTQDYTMPGHCTTSFILSQVWVWHNTSCITEPIASLLMAQGNRHSSAIFQIMSRYNQNVIMEVDIVHFLTSKWNESLCSHFQISGVPSEASFVQNYQYNIECWTLSKWLTLKYCEEY